MEQIALLCTAGGKPGLSSNIIATLVYAFKVKIYHILYLNIEDRCQHWCNPSCNGIFYSIIYLKYLAGKKTSHANMVFSVIERIDYHKSWRNFWSLRSSSSALCNKLSHLFSNILAAHDLFNIHFTNLTLNFNSYTIVCVLKNRMTKRVLQMVDVTVLWKILEFTNTCLHWYLL